MSSPRVDIIGIGVQKSATSWLFSCLLEHSGIRGSLLPKGKSKELNFFNHHYEYGYDWYEACFEPGPWKNMEYSVLYFHDANVPGRIKRYNPNARFVLSLRNPVDRAISQYRHEIRRGRLTDRSKGFWGAVERNPSYVEQGQYATHLARWLEYFDSSQFHIIEYDDIRADPARVLCEAFRFLGVEPEFEPAQTHERINRSVVSRSGALTRALRITSKGVRLAFGATAVNAWRSSAIATRLRTYNRVEVEIDDAPVDGTDRARLVETFAPELQCLGEMIGRDYSHWR